jgi:hypothetical protein
MRLERHKEGAAPKLSGRRVSGICVCGTVELEIDFPAFWVWHDHSAASRRANPEAKRPYLHPRESLPVRGLELAAWRHSHAAPPAYAAPHRVPAADDPRGRPAPRTARRCRRRSTVRRSRHSDEPHRSDNKFTGRVLKVTIDTQPSNLTAADRKAVEDAQDAAAAVEE